MASKSKPSSKLPKAGRYAPQRDPPSSEEIADSLVDAFIKIATDKVADEEWSEGYQAGLADGKYEANQECDAPLSHFDAIMIFGFGWIVASFIFLVTHALHWWM